MKNILIVAPYYYLEGGGLENYAHQVAKGLQKLGHKVIVLCLTKDISKTEIIDAVEIIRKKPDFIISNTPIKLNFIFDIFKIINKYKIELVHAHTPVPYAADMAALAANLKKIPFILTYHSNTLFKGKSLTDIIAAFYLPIQYLTLKSAKQIVFVYRNIGPKFNKWKNKNLAIPPGVDTEQFRFSEYPKSQQNILFISPLSKAYPSKGVKVLFHALDLLKPQLSSFKVHIAGSGDMEDYYKQYAKSLDLASNVEFLGKRQYSDMPAQYQRSNILVVPSLKAEGSPTVIIEAMASGRPVIGTNIGGIPEMIKDNITGLIIKPNDPQNLAQAILRLLKNSNLAAEMGRAGRKIAEDRYSWEKIVKQYDQLIQSI
ncbi:MAG: glycosyltransferase family 4 protein [Patescibacteria group bacterium]|jgi:glycosyltransferase involved in cell wall biosynthesis